jgi:hypothetical protein
MHRLDMQSITRYRTASFLLVVVGLLSIRPLYSQQKPAKPDVIPVYSVDREPNKSAENGTAPKFTPFSPFIIEGEDRFQSYIQNDAMSVWVNAPSLQKTGDTITAVVKRVMRYDITHTLGKDLVFVDVVKFNTKNDTFARTASMDNRTGALAATTKPEWERTTLDLDANALYHFIGFLLTEKQKGK